MASNTQAANQGVCISADFAALIRIQNLTLNGTLITVVEQTKFLGVIFDNKFTFLPHTHHLKEKCVNALLLTLLGEPTSRRCYIFIDHLFVLNSTMAALSMVPHENLMYIGSHTESCIPAMPSESHLPLPLYIRRTMLRLSSSQINPAYNTIFSPKFNAFFSSKPNQISILGIHIALDLEKIGFNRNTVSRLTVSATSSWLIRRPVIAFTLHSSDKAVTPAEVFKVRFYEL